MKRIALVGESPNDTNAIKQLLSRKYKDVHQYFPVLSNITGGKLDSPKAKKGFAIQIDNKKPDYIIVIRDADGYENSMEARKAINWYNSIVKVVGNYRKKIILLLNIQEIEALLLADIDTINKHYGTKISYTKNVMFQEDPKEFLMQKTKKNDSKEKYDENDCAKLFDKLDIDKVIKNCSYFKDFIEAFERAVTN